jgi:hypothetical protein
MERLTVMLGTVLAVSAIVVVPALAQDVPDVPYEPVSEGPGDGLVKEEGPGTPADVPPPPDPPPPDPPPSDSSPPDSPPPPEPPPPDSPPPDAPPPDSSLPPDTPSLDTPPPDVYPPDAPSPDSPPPPDIEDQKAGSGPDLKTDFQDFDGSGTAREAEEREAEDQGAEDREAEIDDIGEAEDEKDEDEAEEDEDGKADDPKQETEQDADSGDVDQSVDVTNTGDNVNLCLGVLQTANTGNAQNAGGVVLDDSEADEIELDDGSSITITPQLIVDCRQIINQIVTVQMITGDNSASGRGTRNLPGLGQLDLGTNKAALKSVGTSNLGLSKAAAGPRALPRTGGGALLGLVAGVLLVAGGLLVRRIFR